MGVIQKIVIHLLLFSLIKPSYDKDNIKRVFVI